MEQKKTYKNADYKKLSERIRESREKISQEDYEMLQELRVSYKTPLSEIFSTLNKIARRIDKHSVCTYRIKRIESIVSKLIRFEKMYVHRMADIAGCRCIMTSHEDVMQLYEIIKNETHKYSFRIKNENNYIDNPKEDGYRSIHLNVYLEKEPNKIIEIQIRSLEHHSWATLVEISDVLFNSKLKEFGNKEYPDLYEFHKLLSKSVNELTLNDKRIIAGTSEKYDYLEKLGTLFNENYISLREQWGQLKLNKKHFFLISTEASGSVDLKGFGKFEDAEKQYFNMFSKNANNKNIVLTHLTQAKFEKISIAYSNYFLTYNETMFRILKAIADVSVYSFNNYKIKEFSKNYKAFWNIILKWFGSKYKEINIYNRNKNIKKSIKKKKEWRTSIISSLTIVGEIIGSMFNEFKLDTWHWVMIFFKDRIDKEKDKQLFLLKKNNTL